MTEAAPALLTVLLSAIVSENIALTYYLGMCPFISISRHARMALHMGVTVTVVMVLTGMANWALRQWILLPLDLEYLEFMVFILTIAGTVQMLELILERFFPLIYEEFGVFLPLITVNCAILGVSLIIQLREYDAGTAVVFALGSGIGWTLAITVLGGIRNHLMFCRPPRGLGEVGITMVIAAVLAMALAGFQGIIGAGPP